MRLKGTVKSKENSSVQFEYHSLNEFVIERGVKIN